MFLLAGCTQEDEAPDATGISLPPGAYPLQIASITVNADGQPGTRLVDNGNTTSWQTDDPIWISLGDQQSVYTYTGSEWHSDNPLCWESTAPQVVNAWYPVDEKIDFTQQDTEGLAYVLKADPVNATYNQSTPINLTFTHQLAKVRVVLDGTQIGQVQTVKVFGYTQCTHNQGTISTEGATPGWLPMYKVDNTTYEANVVPGEINLKNFIQINRVSSLTFPI